MARQPPLQNASWSNHETGAAQLAQVAQLTQFSTGFGVPQRQQPAAGWQRKALALTCIAASVAAIKLFVLP